MARSRRPLYTLLKTRRMKLLIAEDRPALRRVILATVAGLVDEIRDCATTGELGSACATWKPDVVIVDAEMRSMDTTGVVRSLQSMNASLRVIVVSCYDSADLRDAALLAGAVAYVIKDDLRGIARLLSPPCGSR